jgi:hypothetical protein
MSARREIVMRIDQRRRGAGASARVAVVSTAADFFARRFQKPEVDRSETARRLRSARSVTVESAAAVHAVHGPR